MRFSSEQTQEAKVVFAALTRLTREHEHNRSIADLPGTITKKVYKGRTIRYYQWKVGPLPMQIYLGVDSVETANLALLKSFAPMKAEGKTLVSLCKSAMAYGASGLTPKHARVMARLANHGLFCAGGVLVGSHAFLAYQNLFGMQLPQAGEGEDPFADILHPGYNITLAIGVDAHLEERDPIDALRKGFLPVGRATRYVLDNEHNFQLDFVTPSDEVRSDPVPLDRFNVTLQPLQYLQFQMIDPLTCVLPAATGPIVVKVPQPARYAVSKIITYVERLRGARPERATKDLRQAAVLVDHLSRTSAPVLQAAWGDATRRGPAWHSRLHFGLAKLLERYPDIVCVIGPARFDDRIEPLRA